MANSPTGMKPPPTVCHWVARTARRKKYDPPRYTDPSTIEVNPGTILQANKRAVSSADGQKYKRTNATNRNGMITIDSTLVPGNTRSRATTASPAGDIGQPPNITTPGRTVPTRAAGIQAFAVPSPGRALPGTRRWGDRGGAATLRGHRLGRRRPRRENPTVGATADPNEWAAIRCGPSRIGRGVGAAATGKSVLAAVAPILGRGLDRVPAFGEAPVAGSPRRGPWPTDDWRRTLA